MVFSDLPLLLDDFSLHAWPKQQLVFVYNMAFFEGNFIFVYISNI